MMFVWSGVRGGVTVLMKKGSFSYSMNNDARKRLCENVSIEVEPQPCSLKRNLMHGRLWTEAERLSVWVLTPQQISRSASS